MNSTSSAHESESRQPRFFLLFLVLLGELALFPYAGDGGFRFLVFRLLGLVLTVLSVYALSFRPTLLTLAVVLAIPAALQRAILPKPDASALPLVALMLTFAFDVFIVVSIFRRVFRDRRVGSETITGALCIYLLVGFAFSNLYLFLSKVQLSAFYLDPTMNRHQVPEASDFIFYSFATMTSLGANGITPVSEHARSLSVIEAILGILYLAVLVSRLIGMYRSGTES